MSEVPTATRTGERSGRLIIWTITNRSAKYVRLTGPQTLREKMVRVRASCDGKRGWFIPVKVAEEAG